MKKTQFFLALLLTTLLSGCYLLNPKDKNEYLLNEVNYNKNNIHNPLLHENQIYLANKKEKGKYFLIFNNGYYTGKGFGYFKEYDIPPYEDWMYDKDFSIRGRYRIEGDTIILIQKDWIAINQRKGFIGSYWEGYTVEYKGLLLDSGIESLKISEPNPIIIENYNVYEGLVFNVTSTKFNLDTVLIKKLLKRD